MTEAHSTTFDDALASEQLRTLTANLDALPRAEQFAEHVENELWKTVTAQSEGTEEVVFAEIPETGRSVFGLTETESGTSQLPWWLNEFTWTVREPGIDEIEITDPESFRDIKDLDPQKATVEKPELNTPLRPVLQAFKRLRAELGRHVESDQDTDATVESFPPNAVFETDNGLVNTTDEFGVWFDSLLTLCPPVNEPMTALLRANTNVLSSVAEQVLSDEMYAHLYSLGLNQEDVRGDSRVVNETYYECLEAIIQIRGVFDRQIDSDYDQLSRFEAELFEAWAESANPDQQTRQWIKRVEKNGPTNLDPSEERQFAPVAFRNPLRLDQRSPVFTLISKRGSSAKKSNIVEILKSHGILS